MEFLTDKDYEIAAEIGLSEGTVYNRVHTLGWPFEEAISKPKMKRTDKRGSVYDTYLKIATENGIPYKIFYYRFQYGGWSIKDACRVPVRKYRRAK